MGLYSIRRKNGEGGEIFWKSQVQRGRDNARTGLLSPALSSKGGEGNISAFNASRIYLLPSRACVLRAWLNEQTYARYSAGGIATAGLLATGQTFLNSRAH